MFRKTVLVNALSLAFSTAAFTVAVMQPAMAQSNATGTIYGVAPTGADIKVRIENPDTGIRRTVTPEASGRFQATSLPTGNYKVYLLKGDQVIGTADGTSTIGGGSEVAFPAIESTAGVQTVQITGVRRTIDVANTNNGASFSARQLDALPITRNVEAIIQLAPNTTRADSRFDGGASFGGGAASENSYYINGFPVVNPLTGLGASQLPFGAIAEAQVLTGGFGAEFGRSIGGVVNIISKSGTNNWEGGVMYSLAPKSMRATYDNINYANTTRNPNTDNTLRISRNHNTREEQQYGAYLGGPIIKDKLFVFAAYEGNEYDANSVNGFRTGLSNAASGWRRTKTDISRYMLKFDWNISDDHRLEYTGFGDTPDVTQYNSGFNYATDQRTGGVTSTAKLRNVGNNGGISKVLKYTGNLTDDLTVTALFGRTVSEHTNDFSDYNSSLLSVSAPDGSTSPALGNPANPQSIAGNILAPGSKDIVKSGRLDLEYRLGKHTIRGGLDKNKVESMNAGEFKAGGGTWIYYKSADANLPEDVAGGVVPAVATRGGLGAQGYYVSRQLFSTVTTSYGEQSAQYLEDKYQITKDVLLTAGLRREAFKNQNDSKTTFLNMKAQYNPRFAAAWDVFGDASLKLFGTAGRYSVPIPTHISVRGAGRSTYTEQFYTYSGYNADGSPIIVQQLTGPLSGNNEFGQDKDVKTLAALDMKPAYQDELTVGFEKAFSPELNFGAKATYRKMKSTIDDFCDVRPFERYAAANNIAITSPTWGNTCQTFNPGRDNTFYVDYDGTGRNDTLVHLTAEEQGFGKPKRTYAAIDLFAEHPFRNGWYAKVMYTWSQNKGNTEGQVRSDNGQQDVAVTSTWDYPELMVGAYGLLPNDRKHSVKAYGFYAVTPEVMVGGNVLAAAGRPRSCIGSAPSNPNGSPNYSNQTFYCLGATRTANVLTPRGSQGNLPWDTRLDMNVSYKPTVLKGLSLRLDVFNVFNRQTVQNVTEAYNSGNNVSSLYGTPLSLTAPRYAKFTVAYDHKF